MTPRTLAAAAALCLALPACYETQPVLLGMPDATIDPSPDPWPDLDVRYDDPRLDDPRIDDPRWDDPGHEDWWPDTGPCFEPPDCLNAPPDHRVIGGPCISELDCGSGNRCLTESVMVYDGETYVSWLSGTCAIFGSGGAGCDPTDPTTCPTGTACIFFGSSGGEEFHGCIDACKATDTSWNPYDWNCGCREGYRCDIGLEACLPGCSNDRECCEVWEDLDDDFQRDDGEVHFDSDCTNVCDGDDADEYPGDPADCMASFTCINYGDTSATWHSVCLFDSDCPPDGLCLNEVHHTDPETGEPLYPQGICIKRACHLPGRGCGSYSSLRGDCVNIGNVTTPSYVCHGTCETGYGPEDGSLNPCRHPSAGHPYTCKPHDPYLFFPASGRNGLCTPAMIPTGSRSMYTACSYDEQCVSPQGLGMCAELMDRDGLCSAWCDQTLAEDRVMCGAASGSGAVVPGVCALGMCLPSCDMPSGAVGSNGCPTGGGLPSFACYPNDGSYGGMSFHDPAGTGPAGFCLPACASTADCGLLWTGAVTCNTTSGVCG